MPAPRTTPVDGLHRDDRLLDASALSLHYTVIAAAVCWAGFAIIAALVLTHRSDAFDMAGLRMVYGGAMAGRLPPPAWLVDAVRLVTSLGGPLVRNVLASVAAAALLLLGQRMAAARYVLTVVGAWLADVGLKALVCRPRPTLLPQLVKATGYSFPSGHSFNGAAVYIGLALALAGLGLQWPVRIGMIAIALVVTWLVCFTRLWLGVHYPTDVVAGWLGGTGLALLAVAIVRSRAALRPT